MPILGARTRVTVISSLVLVWGALTYACSVDDENPGSSRNRDAGLNGDGSIDPNADPDAAVGIPICDKYGGYDQVKAIASAILDRAKNDCRIGSPISTLSASDMQHFTECFQVQLGGSFLCPGIAYTANTTKDSKNQNCRSMSQAHQGMNLRNADVTAFEEAVTSELSARGLSSDEVKSIAAVFEGSRTQVVQNQTQGDRNTFCTCANGVYNGKPCTVDAGILDSGTDAADAADADGG